jgi:hypothetical protein
LNKYENDHYADVKKEVMIFWGGGVVGCDRIVLLDYGFVAGHELGVLDLV